MFQLEEGKTTLEYNFIMPPSLNTICTAYTIYCVRELHFIYELKCLLCGRYCSIQGIIESMFFLDHALATRGRPDANVAPWGPITVYMYMQAHSISTMYVHVCALLILMFHREP